MFLVKSVQIPSKNIRFFSKQFPSLQVETCTEKIICLELEEPTYTEDMDQQEFDEDAEFAELERKLLGEGDDDDDIDHAVEQILLENSVQTIVEVVNPILTGCGGINDIIIGSGNSEPNSLLDIIPTSSNFPDGVEYESINTKMKKVLKELQQNEKVKLNLSRSLEEEEEEKSDEEDKSDEEFYEKIGTNGTIFEVRPRLINDFYTHDNKDVVDECDDGSIVLRNPTAEHFEKAQEQEDLVGNDEDYEDEVEQKAKRKNSHRSSGIPTYVISTTSGRRRRRNSKKK